MLPVITAWIRGQIQGEIWQPGFTCTKSFAIGEVDFRYSDGTQPSLREMVLRVCSDGDFRSANVSYGDLVLEMVRPRADGKGNRIRTKTFDLREFPSISDSVVEEDQIVCCEMD